MKKVVLQILAMSCILVLMSGCDMFRKLVGKPTSVEIEAKRRIVEQEMLERQAELDSINREEERIADSLAALDSIALQKERKVVVKETAKLGGLKKKTNVGKNKTSELAYRYYVIVGAFKKSGNADRQLARVQKAGIKGELLYFKNGFIAVAVTPTNSLNRALNSLDEMRTKSFCPEDVWILVK